MPLGIPLDLYFRDFLSTLQIGRLEENSHQDFETGCWLSDGAKISSGYGVTYFRGKNETLHRVMAIAMLHYDPLSNLQVLHKRGCPNRNCFNYEHLYIGTSKENTEDLIIMGNHHEINKTHCKQGHEYTPKNTGYQTKGRYCKECDRLRNIENRKRKLIPQNNG